MGFKKKRTEQNSNNVQKQVEAAKKEVRPKKRKEKKVKEKNGKEKNPNKVKKIIIVGTIAVIIIMVGGVVVLKLRSSNKSAGNTAPQIGDMASSTTDAVTAYGVINIGTIEEKLDIDNMTNSLKIKEILFSSGDTVSEGDALVTFTEESVAKALEELETNLRSADLAFRAGEIEYEQNLINAKYTYDSTILKGEQADEVYKESVESYKSSLKSATESYNKSMEQLAEYKELQAGTNYEDYKVDYYKQVYDDNYALLVSKMEEWGVDWQDVTGRGARVGADQMSQYKYVLQSLYSILETNLRNYENALTNYENDTADLNYNLLSLQLNLSTLEETYLNAQKSYETGLLNAEQTRETAKTNAELAESEYEATVEKAKTDYDSLKSKYEDALDDYNTFVARIVNNQYIAETGGSVMRTQVRNNGSVSAGSRILTYSDTSEVTVSVSVDQADIAKLAVGDSAICYASSTGLLNGTITSISPITQSSSISSVTYSVTVKIDNTSASLSANTTVTVMFGVDMSAASNMDLSNMGSDSNGFGEGGFSFDFDMSNLPDMGNMPNFGGGSPFGN